AWRAGTAGGHCRDLSVDTQGPSAAELQSWLGAGQAVDGIYRAGFALVDETLSVSSREGRGAGAFPGASRWPRPQPKVPRILMPTFSGISFWESTCRPGLNTRA